MPHLSERSDQRAPHRDGPGRIDWYEKNPPWYRVEATGGGVPACGARRKAKSRGPARREAEPKS